MATTEQVQEALQQLQAREGTFHAQSSSSSSTQWWTRCTQPRIAHFTRRREREMKSEQEAEHKELEQLTCESDVAEETMSAMVKLAKEIDEPYDIDLPTAECQSRTPSEKRRATRRDKLRPRRWSKRHRGACFDVEDEAFKEKDGYMDDFRSVKDGAEDTDERVMTSHSETCEQSGEGCKVTSVEEGHDVERMTAQSDETVAF